MTARENIRSGPRTGGGNDFQAVNAYCEPIDTRTPVDDNDYQVPFHFTGEVAKLISNSGQSR
jgi:hypothetical protein